MIGLVHGDCLEIMKEIPDNFIDMICCDMPYGVTACKWDSVLPLPELWEQYDRICKDKAAIVLNSSQPFTSTLIMSNPKIFKYHWIWNKKVASNSQLVKYQPLKIHEEIIVFCKTTPKYHPQNLIDCDYIKSNKNRSGGVGHISSEKKEGKLYTKEDQLSKINY